MPSGGANGDDDRNLRGKGDNAVSSTKAERRMFSLDTLLPDPVVQDFTRCGTVVCDCHSRTTGLGRTFVTLDVDQYAELSPISLIMELWSSYKNDASAFCTVMERKLFD